MSFFGGITNIFTGGGALGSLVRTVAMGYIVKKLSNSATKENETGSRNAEQKNAPGIDNGVRLQVPPAADEKIPVLYGSAFFGGIISDAVMSNNNQRMHYVLTLAEKTGTLYSNSAVTSYGFGSIFYNDQTITFKADGVTVDYTTDRSGNRDSSLDGLVKIYCYAGGSGSANQRFPTGTSGTAVNAYSVVNGWTSAHAMNNLVFAVVEVNYSAERNIKGIGDVKFQVTSSMNKPGDVIYDYATNNLYGANIANTEIDTTTITALNSYSANSVTYIDENSVSQTLTNRYQINGLVNTDNAVMQNVEELTSSAGSWLSYSLVTGKWSVIVNRAGTSVASFDDTNILGTVSVSGTGLQDLYNSVKTEFPNRDIRDGTDYVQLSIAAGDRNANEPNNTLNISYNFLNEPVQAQLLGFIELKQSRIDLVITFQSDYTTLNLVPGDIIDVTNSILGFTNKLFRIITVAEVDGDQGLQSEITALEYDSTVYNEDLSRVTRTVTNGFTTTGNIGRPGTPTIVKFEDDARPRIEVSTISPTGTVEGIEYWLSNDVALGEAQRNYRLIDTRQPSGGNANVRGTFTTGETVTLDYDNIGTSNLVIKTRAYNSTTVGPYSANSAVTTFTSTQTTDAIGPQTQAYDELGGLMTALSIVSLLNKLDGLFGNSATGAGGVFGAIKDILFPGASAGTNTVEGILGASNTFQSSINSSISSQVNSPAFQANVSRFTGNLDAYSIDALGDVNTTSYTKTANVSVLAWNGTEWRPATTCCPTITFPAPPAPPAPPGVGEVGGPTPFLNRISTLPPDHGDTFTDELQYVQADQAPQTGSYYAYFTGNTTTQGGNIYSNLVVGTGSVKLYKSNGTLVETLAAASLIIDKNRVEFPFADREYGVNYYIIMDAGVVKYCPDSYVNSPVIDGPSVWNFNTPYYAVPTYASNTHPIGNLTPGSLTTLSAPGAPANPALTVTNISWVNGMCPNTSLVITFSEAITLNSGTVTVTGNSGVIATLAGGTATISGSQMTFGAVGAMTYGNIFTVDVSAGIARTIRSDATNYACGVWANTAATQQTSTVSSKVITTVDAFVLSSYTLTSIYSPGNLSLTTDQINHANVSLESQLVLTFNRSYTLANTSPLNISIYEANGTLHQTFDLKTSYASNKTSEIVVFPSSTSIGLNPTKDFLVGTGYYATISSNILLDSCGTFYPGISNTNTITWTTLPFSSTATVPPNGATNRTVNDTGVAFSFAEPIIPGRGRLKIFTSANVLVANISSTNGNVIYS
jgi:hypothetical protein